MVVSIGLNIFGSHYPLPNCSLEGFANLYWEHHYMSDLFFSNPFQLCLIADEIWQLSGHHSIVNGKVPRNSISVSWTCWVTVGSLKAHHSYPLSHLLARTYNSTLGTHLFGLGLEFSYNFPWKVLLLNGWQLFILCCKGEEPDYFEKERKPGDSDWNSEGEGWRWGWGETESQEERRYKSGPSPSNQGFFSSAVH